MGGGQTMSKGKTQDDVRHVAREHGEENAGTVNSKKSQSKASGNHLLARFVTKLA